MFVTVIDTLSDKILYLIQNNEGKLFDLNGFPFKIISNNNIVDINGRIYFLNKSLDNNNLEIWNKSNTLWEEGEEWNPDLL
jgi:hypothetical protein